ncbi:unnamed protein product, partial [Polarella glacialis]
MMKMARPTASGVSSPTDMQQLFLLFQGCPTDDGMIFEEDFKRAQSRLAELAERAAERAQGVSQHAPPIVSPKKVPPVRRSPPPRNTESLEAAAHLSGSSSARRYNEFAVGVLTSSGQRGAQGFAPTARPTLASARPGVRAALVPQRVTTACGTRPATAAGAAVEVGRRLRPSATTTAAATTTAPSATETFRQSSRLSAIGGSPRVAVHTGEREKARAAPHLQFKAAAAPAAAPQGSSEYLRCLCTAELASIGSDEDGGLDYAKFREWQMRVLRTVGKTGTAAVQLVSYTAALLELANAQELCRASLQVADLLSTLKKALDGAVPILSQEELEPYWKKFAEMELPFAVELTTLSGARHVVEVSRLMLVSELRATAASLFGAAAYRLMIATQARRLEPASMTLEACGVSQSGMELAVAVGQVEPWMEKWGFLEKCYWNQPNHRNILLSDMCGVKKSQFRPALLTWDGFSVFFFL